MIDGLETQNLSVVNANFSGTVVGATGVHSQLTKVLYVDANKSPSVTGNGTSWEEAFLTITEAISAATTYDIIYISQGTYSEAAKVTLTSTHNGLKIFGSGTSGNMRGPTIWDNDTAATDLLHIDGATDVEIAGICFVDAEDGTNLIEIGDTTASPRFHIHDCFFAGDDDATYGIQVSDIDSADGVIERCSFVNCKTAGVSYNATRISVVDNRFVVQAGAIGIDVLQTGNTRADTLVKSNFIIGSNSTDTGIKINATEPTDGTLLVYDNCVTNCATLITQGKSDAGLVNNPTYADGAALAQVDPV